MLRRRSAAGEWIDGAGTWLLEMTRENREHATIFHVPFEDAEKEAAAARLPRPICLPTRSRARRREGFSDLVMRAPREFA
jgi:hypothetical protein